MWSQNRNRSTVGWLVDETADNSSNRTRKLPKVSVRVNGLKITSEELKKMLDSQVPMPTVSEDGMILYKMGNPIAHEWYQKGVSFFELERITSSTQQKD